MNCLRTHLRSPRIGLSNVIFLLTLTAFNLSLAQTRPTVYSVDVRTTKSDSNTGSPLGTLPAETLHIVPGEFHPLPIDTETGVTTMKALSSCAVNFTIEEHKIFKDLTGQIVNETDEYHHFDGTASAFKSKPGEPGGGDPEDPWEDDDPQVVTFESTFQVRVDPPASEEREGAGGWSGPVSDSTDCCSSNYNTHPSVQPVENPADIEGVAATARYEFPVGRNENTLSFGKFVFAADVNSSLAQNWTSALAFDPGPAGDAVFPTLPATAADVGTYMTPEHVFKTEWVNDALEIRQYDDEEYVLANGITTSLTPLRAYKIRYLSGSPDDYLEFSHYEGGSTEPYRVDKFTGGASGGTSETRWEFDGSKRIETQSKQVILSTPSSSNLYRRSTIIRTVQVHEVRNELTYPVSFRRTTHELLKFTAGGADRMRLVSQESGVGSATQREEYTYDLANPSFVGTKTYDLKDPNFPELMSSRVDSHNVNGPFTVRPWLNVPVDSTQNPRLQESESGLVYFSPSPDRYEPSTGKVQLTQMQKNVNGLRTIYSTTAFGRPQVGSGDEHIRYHAERYFQGPAVNGSLHWAVGAGDYNAVVNPSVQGSLWHRIEDYGRAVEYTRPSTFTPPSGSLVYYPADFGPYKSSYVTQNLYGSVGSTGVGEPYKVTGRSTRTETVNGKHGIASEIQQVWDGNVWDPMTKKYYIYSTEGKLMTVVRDGQIVESHHYPDAATEEITDESGVVTVHVRDADGKLLTSTRKGVPAADGWPAQDDVVTTYTETPTTGSPPSTSVLEIEHSQTTAAGGLSQIQKQLYDVEGSSLSSTDELGAITNYNSFYSGGNGTDISTRNSVTSINTRFLDGRTSSVEGTGQIKKVYSYAVKTTVPQGIEETESVMDGSTVVTVNKRLRTGDGELISETVNGITSTFTYNAFGQMTSRTTPGPNGNRVYRYEYDYRNLVTKEGYDLDNNGVLTPASADVFTERDRFYEKTGNVWWLINKETRYEENDSDATAQVVIHRERQDIAAGHITEVIAADGSTETTKRLVDGKVVTTTTTSTAISGARTQILYNGRLVSSQDFGQSHPVRYVYDALGRQTTVTDTGSAEDQQTAYQAGTDLVASSTNSAGETTLYTYYPANHASAGSLKKRQNAAGETTYYQYNLLGQITHQWGSGVQPLRYQYDGAGRLQHLDTFTSENPASWTSEALPSAFSTAAYSRRTFNVQNGRLADRTYGPGSGAVGYTYHTDGSLYQRTWTGAGTVTTYGYNAAGQVQSLAYSDATPGVTVSYDRSGRRKTLTDAAGAHSYVYQPNGDVQETVTGGLLDGLILSKKFNGTGQVAEIEWSFAGRSHKAGYTYFSGSHTHLETATLTPVNASPLVTASYAYVPGTRRVHTLSRPITGAAADLVGTSTWAAGGRLDTLLWKRGSITYGEHDYQLDAVGRRTAETRQDDTRLEYDYTDRGELETATRLRTADDSPRPDWSHGYTYNDSGDRVTTVTPETESLSYSSTVVSGGSEREHVVTPSTSWRWLRGRAHPQALVQVDGQTALREGDLWRYRLHNPATPAAQRVTVTATRPELTPAPLPASQTLTLPPAASLWRFDVRGNLKFDAQWTYTWDAENRLIAQEEKYPGVAGDGARPVRRLVFAYDALGRRIAKTVYAGQRSSNGTLTTPWSFARQTLFLWQDWTLVAEFVRTQENGTLSLRRSYLWGLDVDGSIGGAGGVGGLLWVADYVPGQTESNRQLAPWYDGNGNVMGWVENDGTQALPLHRLEYDPFGKLLVDDAVRVARNQKQRDLGVEAEWLERPPFAFSTKYEDAESGLLYYGYRYYSPEMGRWTSRDPIWERGGMNLHGMVGNDPVNKFDILGMQEYNYGDWPPTLPDPPPPSANQQWDEARNKYLFGSDKLDFEFGPDEPWTKAFRSEYKEHIDRQVKDRVRKSIQEYCELGNTEGVLHVPHQASFTLNEQSGIENALTLLGDITRYTGLSSGLQRLGSFRMTFTIDEIECGFTRKVLEDGRVSTQCAFAKVRVDAYDAFRLGSNFRIPGQADGPADNPFGEKNAPFNTISIHWFWNDTVSKEP